MKTKQLFYRCIFYVIGMILLAVGLTMNTKTGLGVSAIMTVPVAISDIWQLNLGNVTFVFYIVFIVAQMLLHVRAVRKSGEKGLVKYLIMDALQFPLSLIFTRVINLVSRLLPVFKETYPDQFLGSFWGRVLMLVVAVTIAGIGAAMTLNVRLVPNPSDGIIHGLAELTGKTVGFTKNWFDLVNICITLAMGFLCAGRLVAVGIGTVVSAIGMGRVMDLFNHFCKKKMTELSGLS